MKKILRHYPELYWIDHFLECLKRVINMKIWIIFFMKIWTKEHCFDIYAAIPRLPKYEEILFDIRKGLLLNMMHNSTNKRSLQKLIYFAEYHNSKVIQLNCPDLGIDIQKFLSKNKIEYTIIE